MGSAGAAAEVVFEVGLAHADSSRGEPDVWEDSGAAVVPGGPLGDAEALGDLGDFEEPFGAGWLGLEH